MDKKFFFYNFFTEIKKQMSSNLLYNYNHIQQKEEKNEKEIVFWGFIE